MDVDMDTDTDICGDPLAAIRGHHREKRSKSSLSHPLRPSHISAPRLQEAT